MTWVVKLGGSLNADPLLPAWLDVLTAPGAAPVVVVPGGGAFTDAARAAQAQWGVDDLAAHNMAVLGMAQTAQLLHGMQPRLVLASSDDAIRAALAAGRSAAWQPLDALRDALDDTTTWDVTADSLALRLAVRLKASGLALVKACAVDASLPLTELSAAGVVDARFAQWAAVESLPIALFGRDDAARWPMGRADCLVRA